MSALTYRVLQGDVREQLRQLPAESVQCVVTSPPYWGLRDYGVPPSVWGGVPGCDHAWALERYRVETRGVYDKTTSDGRSDQSHAALGPIDAASCSRCGAWRGCLGLEPTPQLFVAHLVEVFREVHRVLRADGTAWVNLGDSYATGAGRAGAHPGGGEQGARWSSAPSRGYRGDRLANGRGDSPAVLRKKTAPAGECWRDGHEGKHGRVGPMAQPNRLPIPGLKPKSLVGIPWRVAFALQDAGWTLRADIIWHKPNPMPESVRDRPTRAHEYLFLLTKGGRYYYDTQAIAEPLQHPADSTAEDLSRAFSRRLETATAQRQQAARLVGEVPTTRNRRTVWTVATQPYPEAHFATYPEELVRPCVLAGSRPGDVVLDPFSGSGTTGVVALKQGRSYVGCELNPEYVAMSERRLSHVAPLLARPAGGAR